MSSGTTDYLLKLMTAIEASSLGVDEKAVLMKKLENGSFTEKDLDHLLKVLGKDAEALRTVARLMDEEGKK